MLKPFSSRRMARSGVKESWTSHELTASLIYSRGFCRTLQPPVAACLKIMLEVPKHVTDKYLAQR